MTSNLLLSKIRKDAAAFRRNKEAMQRLVEELRAEESRLRKGGGEGAIKKQHEKARMTARERIQALLDPGTELAEVMIFAAHGVYDADWGPVACAGVVTGIGKVCGRRFMVIANDATVKAGAFFPMTVKKVIRAQKIAHQNRLPLIYLVDSAGVFLPLQDEVFPDEDDFGRIFRNNAVISADGIAQIAAIMGMCVAGGAYLPVMCDTILMTEGSGLFLAGPALVKAAIGQQVSAEDLGGAEMHSRISGTVDFKEKDDTACIERIRRLVEKMGPAPSSPFARVTAAEPLYEAADLYGIVPHDPMQEYDVNEVIARLVDKSELDEYRPEYGATVVTGYARLGGFAVGIVANQKKHVRDKAKGMQFGGVVYTESADKAARFIMDCNQKHVPLVFLHDVNGFMVGRDAEHSGIIRAGAKMVNVVANSVVPKISVIIGGSFGAGHYAMCGRAYDPRFLFAWPSARYAVMGGAQAAKTLADLRISQLEKQGKKVDDAAKTRLLGEITERYTEATDPRYGAARLWVDAIVTPDETRNAIITALEVASLNPNLPEFKTGVLQT
ncbi:MAG: carboxyl transferase domain-containing protein [Planctomycetota bacterium]